MGSIIGKESVLEPTFKTLLDRPATASTVYQIREYGTRFVGMFVTHLPLTLCDCLSCLWMIIC